MTFRLVEKEELEQLYLNVFCFFFPDCSLLHSCGSFGGGILKKTRYVINPYFRKKKKKTVIYVPDFNLIYRIIESNR